MKNAYAAKLQAKKADELAIATQQGFTFGLCLTAVALNNLYGFGKTRLEAVETECQRLFDEEFRADMELASHELTHRLEQIRGKGWEKKLS